MKIAIITITRGYNLGNRLQNYAVQKCLQKYAVDVVTLKNVLYKEQQPKYKIKSFIKKILYFNKNKRVKSFEKFNKEYINFSNFEISNEKILLEKLSKFNYFICGSDQIWNPNYPENAKVNFLDFCDNNKKISFAASFGSSNVPVDRKEEIKKYLDGFKSISVREEEGKKIVEELTGRKDAKVLVDPTMLLSKNEWDEISSPINLDKNKKYMLCYFLGNITDEYEKVIKKIALDNNFEIINIFDKNSKYYSVGPSEYLYLMDKVEFVASDSFHACVFSIIYSKPFLVFDRVDASIVSMNSRIDTLLSKFELKDRKYNGSIDSQILVCDFNKAHMKLKEERKKSFDYIEKALK